MGWPKGVKRTGYVNKDGSPHAAQGRKKSSVPATRSGTKASRRVASGGFTIRRVSAELFDAPSVKKPVIVVDAGKPEIHGAQGNRGIIEPCPQCGYAYADGGHCPECGWTLPLGHVNEANTTKARKWK